MSTTAVINIRTDPAVKNQVQKLAKELGLSLSALINGYLKQLLRHKTVTFSLSEKPTKFLINSLKESKKNIKEGYVSPVFDNIKDADEWLDNPKAKYANQL